MINSTTINLDCYNQCKMLDVCKNKNNPDNVVIEENFPEGYYCSRFIPVNRQAKRSFAKLTKNLKVK